MVLIVIAAAAAYYGFASWLLMLGIGIAYAELGVLQPIGYWGAAALMLIYATLHLMLGIKIETNAK